MRKRPRRPRRSGVVIYGSGGKTFVIPIVPTNTTTQQTSGR
jgi:hypothetical protein